MGIYLHDMAAFRFIFIIYTTKSLVHSHDISWMLGTFVVHIKSYLSFFFFYFENLLGFGFILYAQNEATADDPDDGVVMPFIINFHLHRKENNVSATCIASHMCKYVYVSFWIIWVYPS